MFKVKKDYANYTTKTFRLPVELLEKSAKYASDNNISLNKFVIQCIEYAIENIDKEEE